MLLVAGIAVLVQAFARFVVEGLGTPSPIAPTELLVVGGWYRYVRNPMYVAVVTAIVGQGLWFAQPVLLGYAALVWVVRRSVRALVRGAALVAAVRRGLPGIPRSRAGLDPKAPAVGVGAR